MICAVENMQDMRMKSCTNNNIDFKVDSSFEEVLKIIDTTCLMLDVDVHMMYSEGIHFNPLDDFDPEAISNPEVSTVDIDIEELRKIELIYNKNGDLMDVHLYSIVQDDSTSIERVKRVKTRFQNSNEDILNDLLQALGQQGENNEKEIAN